MVEYKIGDTIERINCDNSRIKVGDQAVITCVKDKLVYLEGYSGYFAKIYCKLVKPKDEVINDYNLY